MPRPLMLNGVRLVMMAALLAFWEWSAGRLVSQGPPADALSEQVMRDVFRISAYRAVYRDEAVIVPWADV